MDEGKQAVGSVVPNPGIWTDADDAILWDVYPEGGSRAAMAALPHRSKTAITKRASTLSIRANRKQPKAVCARDLKNWEVPTHEYTAADFAVREWRTARPASGVFAPSLGLAA